MSSCIFDEMWPQSYTHLYPSLGNGRSLGEDPDSDPNTDQTPQSDTGPADNLEELEPTPLDEMSEDLEEPVLQVNDAANASPDQSVGPDDVPETNMDRPFQVTSGKEHQYAPTLIELMSSSPQTTTSILSQSVSEHTVPI